MEKNVFMKLFSKQFEKIIGKRQQEINQDSYEQDIDDGISKLACRFIINSNKND